MTDHEKAISIRDRVRPVIEKHGWRDGDTTRYIREPFSFAWRDREAGGRPGHLEVWKQPGGKMMRLEWADHDRTNLIVFRPGDWIDGLDWLLL
jgi:hypothetical protein